MGKDTPEAPDYAAAAEATGASNKAAIRDQTAANRIDQYNPWGSLTFDTRSERDPSSGEMVTRYSQNQKLNPEAQAALDSQLGINRAKSEFASRLMGKAGNTLLQDTDYSKFQDYGSVPTITNRELGVPQYGGGGGGEPDMSIMPVDPNYNKQVPTPSPLAGLPQKELEMNLLRGKKRSNDVIPTDYT
jgi:hypothetical protein